METETIIADLAIVEERIEKIDRLARVSKEKHEDERAVLEAAKAMLSAGRFIDAGRMTPEDRELLRSFNLICAKPFFYIANIDEKDVGREAPDAIGRFAAHAGRKVVPICGKLEKSLPACPKRNGPISWEMYGMTEVGIERIIKVGYDILDLVTFYTVVGKELRAWTVKKETPVAKAAGKIHSDMERGFIRAEGHSVRRLRARRLRACCQGKRSGKGRRKGIYLCRMATFSTSASTCNRVLTPQ